MSYAYNPQSPYGEDMYDRYFTTAQSVVVFNNPKVKGDGFILGDEVFGISYRANTSLTPYYGYASRYFDAVVRGKYLVEGEILIYYRYRYYMYALMNGSFRNERTILGEVPYEDSTSDSISVGNYESADLLSRGDPYDISSALEGLPDKTDLNSIGSDLKNRDMPFYRDYSTNNDMLSPKGPASSGPYTMYDAVKAQQANSQLQEYSDKTASQAVSVATSLVGIPYKPIVVGNTSTLLNSSTSTTTKTSNVATSASSSGSADKTAVQSSATTGNGDTYTKWSASTTSVPAGANTSLTRSGSTVIGAYTIESDGYMLPDGPSAGKTPNSKTAKAISILPFTEEELKLIKTDDCPYRLRGIDTSDHTKFLQMTQGKLPKSTPLSVYPTLIQQAEQECASYIESLKGSGVIEKDPDTRAEATPEGEKPTNILSETSKINAKYQNSVANLGTGSSELILAGPFDLFVFTGVQNRGNYASTSSGVASSKLVCRLKDCFLTGKSQEYYQDDKILFIGYSFIAREQVEDYSMDLSQKMEDTKNDSMDLSDADMPGMAGTGGVNYVDLQNDVMGLSGSDLLASVANAKSRKDNLDAVLKNIPTTEPHSANVPPPYANATVNTVNSSSLPTSTANVDSLLPYFYPTVDLKLPKK